MGQRTPSFAVGQGAEDHPLWPVYRRVRDEWQAAWAAWEAGDGDPDVLAARLYAAERGLDLMIRVLKAGPEGPAPAKPAVRWPWWPGPTP